MPQQKSKTGLLAKYGPALKTAYEEHRNDETEFSQFGDLPAGMNGIARLVDCKFDTVKEGKELAGEVYFYAAGQVVDPAEFKDKKGVTHRVEGLRTSLTEMMCDTPGRSRATISDHVKWVLNQLRMLGVDTRSVGLENLESTVAMLKEAKPYFKFRTWRGEPTEKYPDPKTNHTWEGAVEFDEGDTDAGSATDDDTLPPSPSARAATGANGAAKANVEKLTTMANSLKAKPGTVRGKEEALVKKVASSVASAYKAAEEELAPEFNEMEDAESLLALANAEDEEAQQKLTDMAIAAGADQGMVSDAASWDDVYDLYKRAAEGGEVGEPEEEEPVEDKLVKREEVYLYNPPGYKKPIECEVVSVDAVRRIANLMNLDDKKKTYKGVSWDKLQPIS